MGSKLQTCYSLGNMTVLDTSIPHPPTPEAALQLLLDGNRRYVNNAPHLDESPQRRAEVARGQHPYAMVLGCVDSRVPPELIFDSGLGELLVVRTAGHVLDHAVLGSLEFGIEALKIPLLVVLGHDRCGAVKSTLDALEKHMHAHEDIDWLVEHIKPAFEVAQHEQNLLDATVKAHVRITVNELKQTPILREAVEQRKLQIVGAMYNLESGKVKLL
ncbi:carbonic anhydrase [Deinococcus cellulosilyticus NBRC 106333 = KACC 11606]|uniref:Carbonic anhydrase n=2 Tax=Deinococcus cellulosilyticus TaxID=401558 RepID=A0A511NA94_DEIC1|nr:carbonic anhydrase [Deinococcus cellulosilyticus NBRC 106333 = KACC 11606]